MQKIQSALSATIKNLFNIDLAVEISRPDEQFGDFATNVALQLAGKLQKNPREVATQIVADLKNQLGSSIKNIQIAGPGFINITLTDAALAEIAKEALQSKFSEFANQTVVIETNNPNPFKDMHIGHAYNCIIADTLANLIELAGADLHRVSYHGDVGLHVGKSLWAILQFVGVDASKLNGISVEDRPEFLSEMYAKGAVAYEQDDLAKQQIEELTKQTFNFQDEFTRQVYETCKQWSFDFFDSIFKRLGSKPIEKRYLERDADKLGREIVEKNLGNVFEKSEGAVIFPGEKYGLHTRVFINSRGNTLYEARDLGLMQLKARDYNPKSSYIVTAIEQKEYFQVVLKAAGLCLPELSEQTHNIATGTVKLSSGKMSSRTGQVINIGWLFDEIEKALKERGTTGEALEAAVTGALRYTMLKNRTGSDVIFDVNEAISLDGNSGPYLQYAHARARSILAKSENSGDLGADFDPHERSLVRKISEYPEVVQKSVADLLPHHICAYLYELAQNFNRFYEKSRVIGNSRESIRLQLVKMYADVLQEGLKQLGIPAPEHL